MYHALHITHYILNITHIQLHITYSTLHIARLKKLRITHFTTYIKLLQIAYYTLESKFHTKNYTCANLSFAHQNVALKMPYHEPKKKKVG